MTRTLFLHIGHGKTGSSFLQTLLSNNQAWLREEHGIHYPQGADDDAKNGQISSGNGNLLFQSARDGAWRDSVVPDDASHVLLSSELLYHRLSTWIDAPFLRPGRPFERIEILLFVRDPLELVGSTYQQVVKRHGYTETIDTYTDGFKFHSYLGNVINRLHRIVHGRLTIVNYSRTRDAVQDVMNGFLGVPSFPNILYPRVNRSLTYAELAFQRGVNRQIGEHGRVLADALCNSHPNIRSDVIIPSRKAWTRFMEREGRFIDAVNEVCPPGQALTTDYVPADETKWTRTIGLGQIGTINRMLESVIEAKNSA